MLAGFQPVTAGFVGIRHRQGKHGIIFSREIRSPRPSPQQTEPEVTRIRQVTASICFWNTAT